MGENLTFVQDSSMEILANCMLLHMQLSSEWLNNCIAVTDCDHDRLYMYHVFDVVENK